jgi:2,5-diketo-D-gluconate reductase A
VTDVPTIELNNGVQIPQFGFGVFDVAESEAVEAVLTALEAGYRHIDTAQLYGNEAQVGEAIRRSGLSRDDLFITTKLHNDRHGRQSAKDALDESLERLQTDHVDLYLLHWPVPPVERYVESWQALEELQADGCTRAIGVSNVGIDQLRRLAAHSETVPAVNQVEMHPWLPQQELREYHGEHGIVTEAWRPIAKAGILDHPTIVGLAQTYGKTPAQVVLRWHIQLGVVVFPKSVTPSRIRENIDVFDFAITDEDMAVISALDDDPRKPPSRISEVVAMRPSWTA